ncbi:MAG: hypothetical protein OXC00_01855 [Acidimicrobiaceae bacterium]|nr:hypothetical protein [Acidimicrobiaceae bacterium]
MSPVMTADMSDMTAEQLVASDAAADRAAALFADARALHDAALARLEADDIRDAAEKAWCAIKRATDGLVVARTGEEPNKSPVTTRELNRLAADDPDINRLTDRYHVVRDALHGDCFYLGFCEPIDRTERLIRETIDYIDEVERLTAA